MKRVTIMRGSAAGYLYLHSPGRPESNITICYKHWVKAGGMKLKLGEGPIDIDLLITCKPLIAVKKAQSVTVKNGMKLWEYHGKRVL